MKEFLNKIYQENKKVSLLEKCSNLVSKHTRLFKEFFAYVLISTFIFNTLAYFTVNHLNVDILSCLVIFGLNFLIGFVIVVLFDCLTNSYKNKFKDKLIAQISAYKSEKEYQDCLRTINLIDLNHKIDNGDLEINDVDSYINQLENKTILHSHILLMISLITSDNNDYFIENEELLNLPLEKLEELTKVKLANFIQNYESAQDKKDKFLKKYATNIESSDKEKSIFKNNKSLSTNL
jgi:hypothetical protein